MNPNQKFYKTVYRVVVLTDDGALPEGMDLGSIAYTITEGGSTGKVYLESSQQISEDEMKSSLDEIGAPRSFFMLDE